MDLRHKSHCFCRMCKQTLIETFKNTSKYHSSLVRVVFSTDQKRQFWIRSCVFPRQQYSYWNAQSKLSRFLKSLYFKIFHFFACEGSFTCTILECVLSCVFTVYTPENTFHCQIWTQTGIDRISYWTLKTQCRIGMLNRSYKWTLKMRMYWRQPTLLDYRGWFVEQKLKLSCFFRFVKGQSYKSFLWP